MGERGAMREGEGEGEVADGVVEARGGGGGESNGSMSTLSGGSEVGK